MDYGNQFYLTIEDLNPDPSDTTMSEVEQEIKYDNSQWEITTTSCNEQYIVLKCCCDEFGDVKDLCSTITSILLEFGIFKFSILYQP